MSKNLAGVVKEILGTAQSVGCTVDGQDLCQKILLVLSKRSWELPSLSVALLMVKIQPRSTSSATNGAWMTSTIHKARSPTACSARRVGAQTVALLMLARVTVAAPSSASRVASS